MGEGDRVDALEAADFQNGFSGQVEGLVHLEDAPIGDDLRGVTFAVPSGIAEAPALGVGGETLPREQFVEALQVGIGEEFDGAGLYLIGRVAGKRNGAFLMTERWRCGRGFGGSRRRFLKQGFKGIFHAMRWLLSASEKAC